MVQVYEVEMLYEVWKVTEWRNGAVYKTKNTGETRWLTQEEYWGNHTIETDIIFAPMPSDHTEPTVRTRKGQAMASNTSKLLEVLKDLAPNDAARQKCSDMIGDMFKEEMTTLEIDAALAGAIYDGIKHGNWPWTEGMVPKKS